MKLLSKNGRRDSLKEELKPIKGFPYYYISNFGNVYSEKSGKRIKLQPFLDGKGKYLLIGIINTDGVRKKKLVHRLVAQAFIPNPNNLPEVNHKDKNTQNAKVDNLEWCTRKDNLYASYSTMSPVRNFNQCELYKGTLLLGKFQSIKKAAKYAKETFGASESSLNKYLRWGEIYIIPVNLNRTIKYNEICSSTQNRKLNSKLKRVS